MISLKTSRMKGHLKFTQMVLRILPIKKEVVEFTLKTIFYTCHINFKMKVSNILTIPPTTGLNWQVYYMLFGNALG
jgi:hypothetical protein